MCVFVFDRVSMRGDVRIDLMKQWTYDTTINDTTRRDNKKRDVSTRSRHSNIKYFDHNHNAKLKTTDTAIRFGA